MRQYPVTAAAEEAKVAENTTIQSYQYLGDICSWRLTTADAPLLLGGNGVVVQIDESLFRHKPKLRIIYVLFLSSRKNVLHYMTSADSYDVTP